MPSHDPYDFGYGEVWTDAVVYRREGYSTSVKDYHEHAFFEINLILSGNVKVLLANRAEDLQGCGLILTRPHTPHYIACRSDTLYSRLYLLFTPEFVVDTLPEWKQLADVFGEHGAILLPSPEEALELRARIEQIKNAKKALDKRLLICYLLSTLCDLAKRDTPPKKNAPSYVIDALAYLEQHYSERIVAADLAKHLHVGRTALMTEFKRHTDFTLAEYLISCRLRHALGYLGEQKPLDEVAMLCGFSDVGALIRHFKQRFGTTPKQYMKQKMRPDVL